MTEETVGSVVGSHSHIESGSATTTYQPSNVQYDIAIGGLPFRKAASDERPYARETAEFRRQQIDQSSQPGDQSLVGMWTRSQLSFHRGAGVQYYELSDGETVINRFTDSEGVDTWTPGAVTVRNPIVDLSAVVALDAVLHDGAVFVLRSDGLVRKISYGGGETAAALTAAGTSTSICSDGVNLYATNADKIDVRAPAGAFSTLFTHPSAGTWSYVWWAKSRLWMMDTAGRLYTEAPSGALAVGDLLWSSGYANAAWTLCESEGAVFIASRDTIWASTVDAQTATPVLGAPVVVARVGVQETIGNISAYLGYLTVASSAGVRVARIGDGILLGDLIVEGDASNCSRMAFRKSHTLVTGVTADGTLLYEVDMLEQVTELTPAYAPVRNVGTTSSKHGSFVLPDGRVGYFSSNGMYLESASVAAATGSVTTAFHRFGTLEPKDFRTISVFGSGENGTISVELIRRDGAAYPLVTLSEGLLDGQEVALNLPGPTDYVGLRFTLTANGLGAPTLLGYQLRALPAPKRQRLIQLPLHCFDEETIGNTKHGYRGWARDRLFALEDMEQSTGVVMYQDFLLDEQALVLIEKVQFQNFTPARSDGSGFGGFLVVTLRKVA